MNLRGVALSGGLVFFAALPVAAQDDPFREVAPPPLAPSQNPFQTAPPDPTPAAKPPPRPAPRPQPQPDPVVMAPPPPPPAPPVNPASYDGNYIGTWNVAKNFGGGGRSCSPVSYDIQIRISNGIYYFRYFNTDLQGEVKSDGTIDYLSKNNYGGVRITASVKDNVLSGQTKDAFCIFDFQLQKR